MAVSMEAGFEGAATRARSADIVESKPKKILAHAARLSGRGNFELSREQRRLMKGVGRLTVQEYVRYGLYNLHKYAAEDQARFLGREVGEMIRDVSCDVTWTASVEDTWLFRRILRGSGIAVPRTIAVAGPTDRAWPGVRHLDSADALRAFFLDEVEVAVTITANTGRDVRHAEGADKDGLYLRETGMLRYEDMLREGPWLIDPVIRPHPFFDQYTFERSIVQLTVVQTRAGTAVPYAVLVLPEEGEVPEVLCALEAQTGRILTARSFDGIGFDDHQSHPGTGADFAAQVVPHWDEVLEMAASASAVFAPLRMQTMEVLVSRQGPVLMHVRPGPDVEMVQAATGEGFLTDGIRTAVGSYGLTLR
ncbi:hypothetical protein HKCCE3408_09785 [Rhodobacterales bacterium HKCCE3408]|nr:hypothetical protein [Rhodobacterales bacterium HKCCE3408]